MGGEGDHFMKERKSGAITDQQVGIGALENRDQVLQHGEGFVSEGLDSGEREERAEGDGVDALAAVHAVAELEDHEEQVLEPSAALQRHACAREVRGRLPQQPQPPGEALPEAHAAQSVGAPRHGKHLTPPHTHTHTSARRKITRTAIKRIGERGSNKDPNSHRREGVICWGMGKERRTRQGCARSKITRPSHAGERERESE